MKIDGDNEVFNSIISNIYECEERSQEIHQCQENREINHQVDLWNKILHLQWIDDKIWDWINWKSDR